MKLANVDKAIVFDGYRLLQSEVATKAILNVFKKVVL